MRATSAHLRSAATTAFVVAILYVSVAAMVFSYRNPTANEAALFRDTHAVLTFQKLKQYQTPPTEGE